MGANLRSAPTTAPQSATGVAHAARCRLKGIIGSCSTAGIIELRDGATGPVKMSLRLATGNINIMTTDGEWLFNTSLHLTLVGGTVAHLTFVIA